MPKKILVVVSSLNRGGTEQHIAWVFPALCRAQYEVIIYTTHHRGQLASLLEKAGVTVYSSSLSSFLHRLGRLGRWCAYGVSILRLCWLAMRYRPDVIHCYLPGPYLLGGLCAYLVGVPCLIMSRRSLNHYQKQYPRLARWELKLHRQATYIVANSKCVFNQLLKEEGVSEKQLVLLYNGLDPQPYRQMKLARASLRARLQINNATFVITMVANLFAYKGHRDLLKALVIIKRDLPSDWVLLLVGREEGMGPLLRHYAVEHSIDASIRWLGERDDVPALWAVSDVGVLCSYEEGFSNSVLEGMASGVPMVVTKVGGNPEAVIDGQTGWVVPPRDPFALGQALLCLGSDSNLRCRMGQAAAQRLDDYFSLSRCLDSYRRLYDRLS